MLAAVLENHPDKDGQNRYDMPTTSTEPESGFIPRL